VTEGLSTLPKGGKPGVPTCGHPDKRIRALESCAACHEKKRRESYDPRIRADYNLKKAYGLSLTKYDELLEKQQGVCAVCERVCSTGRKLAVDHSHVTGKIRGLLCARCNLALGWYEAHGPRVNGYLEESL
jgi:hypothetical protein